MLTEERHAIILDTINRQHSVRLNELCELLGTSESTIRRDLTALDEKGLLTKVHGGAIAIHEKFSPVEHSMEEKSKLYTEEKEAIAKYAASLVEDGDFVFVDAGTTTEKMIDYLPEKKATFVTNGFVHAKRLAQRGFKVLVLAGEFKLSTEAVVGASWSFYAGSERSKCEGSCGTEKQKSIYFGGSFQVRPNYICNICVTG